MEAPGERIPIRYAVPAVRLGSDPVNGKNRVVSVVAVKIVSVSVVVTFCVVVTLVPLPES